MLLLNFDREYKALRTAAQESSLYDDQLPKIYQRAKTGSVKDQYAVGMLYRRLGNNELAFAWLMKSAEKEHADSEYEIALIIKECGSVSVEDKDGDGFVDEPQIDRNLDGKIDPPYDFDGDGSDTNTSYEYEEVTKLLGENVKRGITESSVFTNFNITVPPAYIRIVGNDGVDGAGGYVYYVTNTASKGISDGGYYRDMTFGGFYGGTRFIWGDGENESIIGTDIGDREDVKTFVFE